MGDISNKDRRARRVSEPNSIDVEKGNKRSF